MHFEHSIHIYQDSKNIATLYLALVHKLHSIFFLAGLGRNLVHGTCYSVQMAHKPVQSSSEKLTTGGKSLLS